MYIVFINYLPKNGENNYDYCMEGLTIQGGKPALLNSPSMVSQYMAEHNTLCKMTSIL